MAVVINFLEENWVTFLDVAAERGIDEEQVEEFVVKTQREII